MNGPNPQRLVDLVNGLLRHTETSWVEFKRNNTDPEMIGIRVSAISNAARLAGQQTGYILWGVDNDTRTIVGTTFDADAHTVGNQVFALWLAQRLSPSIVFQFHAILHSHGRLVLMEIPAATSAPVTYNGIAYIRIGSATPKLTDYPDRYQALLTALRPYAWERGIALAYVTSDDVLDRKSVV